MDSLQKFGQKRRHLIQILSFLVVEVKDGNTMEDGSNLFRHFRWEVCDYTSQFYGIVILVWFLDEVGSTQGYVFNDFHQFCFVVTNIVHGIDTW